MRTNSLRRVIASCVIKSLTALFVLFACTLTVAAQALDWPQWGGAHRNFMSDAKGLATVWPEGGPRRLWQRELGEGYSAIAAEGGRLYTMSRRESREIVIALDAATGKTVWEYAYEAPFSADYSMENGTGPHATPTIAGERVFTAGATGKLHALDKRTGKLLWSHDLLNEYKGTIRVNGYACSPLAYRDTVIMQVGGEGNALMAFRQKDGSVAWKRHDFKNSPSSPLLINVDGQDQLVAFMYDTLVGVDPASGELLWSRPHKSEFGLNVSTPVWGSDNLLFISSSYGGGSRVFKISRAAGKTELEEVWAHALVRIHYGNAVRLGDFVYASSGDFGTAPFTAVNVKTGKIAWRDRSIARASVITVEGRLIILDEDGNLLLATPTPEGLKVHSKIELLKNNAWTVPTLAGTRLYVRDRKTIMALDLK
ncbi:MAG TPA: PQQ-binding-like beta-propeller repeat protein [Pyrinomonadaceae bacterium]|nr:PQQ-binding-like beta-propeller repeat protein [Pyrinomonadaceae bacterium]